MLQRQLRKDFARALCKATLVVMLPLSLATASVAAAQETGGNGAVPTEQSTVQDTLLLQEGETVTVLPQTESNLDSVETRYPFLKDVLADVREYNEEFKDDPNAQTRILTSSVRDAQKNVDIFVVSVEGPMTCGAAQCQVNIFVNSGEGYKQAFAGPAPLPVLIRKESDEVSFYFCSVNEGRAQWTLKGDTLEHQGNVIAPQSGPPCPGH